MVLALFFCSGATALVYEVVWSKLLAQMFGSTIYAQTVVLAVFMGGLALGNRLIGARSDLLRQPLAVYGYLEILIGLYAFFFSWTYLQADRLFVASGSRLLEHSALLLLLKGVLSVLLLLGPTVLMGGTLPLLAAWLQRSSEDAGRLSARFYSTNSLGAVCGSALAGFFLVRALGMVATLEMTALVNVLIGFVAVALARRVTADSPPPQPSKKAEESEILAPTLAHRGAALVSLTGGVSMGLEVLASRSLALIFGSSLQAFAIVLMSFILGIGLGSAAIASPRLRRWHEEGTLFMLLLSAAAVIGTLVWGIEEWVQIYRHVRTGLARTEMGYVFHQFAVAAISMVVLGLPAALLGAVLPVCIRAEGVREAGFGRRVGQLLTWNTVGAVAGVLMTGFVLMPRLGLRAAFVTLAILLCTGALLLSAKSGRKWATIVSVAMAGLLSCVWALGGEGWRHVLSSGVFRARETVVNPGTLESRKKHIKLLFYEDAADATVTVEEGDGIGAPNDRGLRINGKPDASTRGDLSTQLLVAHLPMLARPQSTEVFVLGFGSGISAGALLGYPVKQVVIAENCEPVLRAGHWFDKWNRGVLTNPVVQIWNEDARTVLKLSPRKFDVIISQPSNPWMVGVGSVFSREYYELAARRLKEGGVMCQWFHAYEMSDDIVGLVFRTFASVFPWIEIWDAGPGDVVLLGSARPWASSLELCRDAFEREEPRRDFVSIGLRAPEVLLARQLASQRTAFAIPGRGPIQSDAFPILEYEAPRAFYIGANSTLPVLFDERTWQMDLAPQEKQSALSGLATGALNESFDAYSSVNPQLLQYLSLTRDSADTVPQPILYSSEGPVPCIFMPTNLWSARISMPARASDGFKRALVAEAGLRRNSTNWREYVDVIESLLRSARAESVGKPLDWSPGKSAGLAAKNCFRHGEIDRAAAVVALGLEVSPESQELHYLARVFERRPNSSGTSAR